MPKPRLLQGERVRLTAVTPGDLPTIAGWHEDADFLRLYAADPAYPKNADQLKTWIEEQQKATDGFLFAVRLRDGDGILGMVGFDGILWPHRTAWTSIAIGGRANWGKGYGREAMELALTFAFDELNLYRVQLTVFSYNARAMALYEGLGFRREGVCREFLERDGHRYDMILYGLLSREWRERQGDTTADPNRADRGP